MGQTLSEPVTAKETSSCGNSYVKVGSSCMQGWRINMEDAHTHLLAVPEDKEACFFAVFDGHGGAKVAQYAGNHLHKKIIQSEYYAQGKIEDAIREGFLRLDEDMIKDEHMKDEMAGTTAVVVLIKEGKIFCGNVGDSRAIASVGGIAEPLSFDHKPANELEAKRIIAAGGWVEFNRVNGNLALSRALGDFIFKRNEEKPPEEQIVTAFPDVIVRDMTPDYEFILLACDGIWDVMSNQEVIDFCRERLAANLEPETICEELLSRCLAPDCQMGGLGCDNMTVVLACLLQNKPWDELKRKCQRPRPPSPPLMYDDSNQPFVTPPPTPFGKSTTPCNEAETNVHRENEDEEGTYYPSVATFPQQGSSVGQPHADQTVPEVVRESSSDSESSVTPSKQGKMNFEEAVRISEGGVVAATVTAHLSKEDQHAQVSSSSSTSTISKDSSNVDVHQASSASEQVSNGSEDTTTREDVIKEGDKGLIDTASTNKSQKMNVD